MFVFPIADLESQRKVPLERAKALADYYRQELHEVSARTGVGVREAFESAVEAVVKRVTLDSGKVGVRAKP